MISGVLQLHTLQGILASQQVTSRKARQMNLFSDSQDIANLSGIPGISWEARKGLVHFGRTLEPTIGNKHTM